MSKKKATSSPTHQVQQSHLLNHGPTPEPVKRSAAVRVAECFLHRPAPLADLAETLDMLGLWPEDNPHHRPDEGLVTV